ncbi:MAG TPA: DUF4136 domain-containing protein [Cytophagales bacterium]|jgi:hypothetical protein|nr:DUF4136 domain-containing protein [Cytophagales bacterium]
MKKPTLVTSAIIIIALFIHSCSSLKTNYDYDKSADFSQYETFEYYGWAENSDKILNDLEKKRIEGAFAEEFFKRGLELARNDGDMVVSLFIVVDQKTSKTAYTNHYGGGPYMYGAGWGWYGGYGAYGGMSTTTYTESDYLEGTLIVDVFDKESKKLIWQGTAQKVIEENPQKRAQNIPKVAAALMRKFPVEPKR